MHQGWMLTIHIQDAKGSHAETTFYYPYSGPRLTDGNTRYICDDVYEFAQRAMLHVQACITGAVTHGTLSLHVFPDSEATPQPDSDVEETALLMFATETDRINARLALPTIHPLLIERGILIANDPDVAKLITWLSEPYATVYQPWPWPEATLQTCPARTARGDVFKTFQGGRQVFRARRTRKK